ncbi:MAG TPA: SpoIIE family protein phosphatase [Chlamydiales bacterium]|nr:SpoIIE family protein phosphatase [Chlamydiales bacterium]
MADSKISKKHHPSGFLAWRLLTVSILLLVIPLFLQSLFLYRQEYSERLKAVEANLQDLGNERAFLIQQMIEMNWTLLDAADTSNVKPLYIERIPLPQGVADHFVLISRGREALLVGKKETATSAEVIAIPFSRLAKDLGSYHPIQLVLIDSKGRMLEGSKKIESTDLLVVKSPIGGTDLSLQLKVDENRIYGLHLSAYYFRFATLVFFVGVLGGGAVYLLTRRISKPLTNLCKTMERVSEGAGHVRYTPDRMGFEINSLGNQFNETMDALQRSAQEAEKQRIGREKLAEELRIGHDIQAGLLPTHVPGIVGIDIATGNLSAKEVNGDFYDLLRLDNGQLLIVMCDLAGKGISACLYSLGLRSTIRSFASTTADVAEIVRKTNDLFWLDAHESAMFATLWLGLYDPVKHHLTYCTQGHPPAYLRRGSQIQELWTGGIALGAQKLDVIPTKVTELLKGDVIVLYTDGIIEAHDPYNHLFGKKRLEEFLLRKKRESSQQIANQLIEEVHLFAHGAAQHDDMALIVMKIVD